jgi:hypothetical protein
LPLQNIKSEVSRSTFRSPVKVMVFGERACVNFLILFSISN